MTEGPRDARAVQGCSPKKEVGERPKQDLDKDFLNNLGLHTRTLIHVRKIATADLWSYPATISVLLAYLLKINSLLF